ncbi:MAG: ABC transporter ATP-binding protein/permease [Clostridia bacterium]|nr:ABC transporter ATP-binding protein/permease [Clostridia bacterium]
MLQLKNITKNYLSGDTEVKALKGIDLEFRESEFVSILGPSGCGKTTLLNIIGGLDRYTTGDLIINDKSTKEFKDKDWDTYRNHSIGFVFQNYNLIPHQTVLANVELALTISGVSKEERRKRAKEALEKVGLGDQLNKKPNQMSGGQMQRVAIARALVNDPDILLADEPTGALDSQTSIQVMEILKEIANDRLIIMVTHNPDLAEKYSTRIIKLLDGKVTDDSNPYEASKRDLDRARTKKEKSGKASMKFGTAVRLSLNNLMTKKGRTFLTSFAGSIGIIGIALIMSLSHGMQSYIDRVEEDTLSSYPLTIQEATIDMSSMMEAMMGDGEGKEHEEGKIYSRAIVNEILETVSTKIQTNNLEAFRTFIEGDETDIKNYINAIQYSYNLDLNIYKQDDEGNIQQVNPSIVFDELGFGDMIQAEKDSASMMGGGMMMTETNVWTEMLDNQELIQGQYDVVAGKWPEKYNEVVLIVDENNEISDYTLYSLGIKNAKELSDSMEKIKNGEELKAPEEMESYTYEDILNYKFKVLLNTDYYKKAGNAWQDMSEDSSYMKEVVKNAEEISIVGIIKPNSETVASSGSGMIGYNKQLKEYVINKINESEIVKEQKANPEINVFTGIGFPENKDTEFDFSQLSNEQKMYMASLSQQELAELMQTYTANAKATYDTNLTKLGVVDLNKPSIINIYPKDFDSKEMISNIITDYNNKQSDEGKEENVINYTDIVGIMMSSVSTIIDVISYVLIAFVGISLVVSSIMIGIITYISVLERTKEIGILRSIGASKKDISRVFNAETLIVGLVAGLIGIGTTVLLNIPINMIIKSIVGISNISKLPFAGGTILVVISVVLTMIAGLIPAKFAAKRDPVEALRSE